MYFPGAGGMIEMSPLKLRHPTSMSTSNVVSLDERRGHRETRLRLTLALYGVEERRGLLASRLGEVLELTGADRGALVWIDEYGPGLVHPHCVLDLISDAPRRSFAMEPLRSAWERGIPGLLDEPDIASSGHRILTESPRSLAAVALGSDGLRAWFLVVDSKTPRTRFDAGTADSLMFLAGECASIVIHEDLRVVSGDGGRGTDTDEMPSPVERERRSRFPGWPVLQDVPDSTGAQERDRLVTLRFLAARLLRELSDDDFAVPREDFGRRVEVVRREAMDAAEGARVDHWNELFDSLEGRDYHRLAGAVLDLALRAEDDGHLHGAREFHRIAYDVSVVGAHADRAVDAARFLGRVNRRLGSWQESQRWYEAAGVVARAAELARRQALALDGLGNTYRVKGSLPKAREAYGSVLEMGDELGDPDLLGRAHQNLALVEKHAGSTDAALKHAWAAVRCFTEASSPLNFFRALGDLGDIFMRCGELENARHAFELVAGGVDNLDVRAGALNMLVHIAALRGDRAAFGDWTRRLNEEPLERVSIEISAEILLHRGRAHLTLGEEERAETWLRRALEFAEEHRLTRTLFEAEDLLAGLDDGRASLENELPCPAPETLSELEAPLRALRTPPVATTT